MSKRLLKKILGTISLVFITNINAEDLKEVIVNDISSQKEEFKEEAFYKSYSSELITKEDINENSISNIKDAIKNVSNVSVKDTGAFGKMISIRGFSSNRVVTVVDGIKLGNQGLTKMGGGESGLVNTANVQSIELIKSSPSVLYDPGATGGVIKINTLKNINKLEDMLSLKYNYLNDSGYKQEKHTISFEAKYKKAYIQATYSKNDSKDRVSKNKEKTEKILRKINAEEERYGTIFEVKNLGYNSENKNIKLNYNINDELSVFANSFNNVAYDITNTYGSSDPIVFHYDEYSRKGYNLGIKSHDLLKSKNIEASFASQKIEKKGKSNILNEYTSKLEAKQFDLKSEYSLGNNLLIFGAQVIDDKAKTYTYSRQKYKSLFLNNELYLDNFIINTGLRFNDYTVSQRSKEGENLDVAKDLIGPSGILSKDLRDNAFNYALGLTYLVNDSNNLALNYSKTYRYPNLYERFAFDGGFIGGGSNLEAEEANNFEFSWKYKEDTFNSSFVIFYSDFDKYNSLYTNKIVKNQALLNDCINTSGCNPLDDGQNESKIYDSVYKYASFDDVKQKGFEFRIGRDFSKINISTEFNIAYTKIADSKLTFENSSESLRIIHAQEPLEFGFNLRKSFNNRYKPWVKLQGRYVSNSPKVKQRGGFDAFSVFDVYFGARINNIIINAGLRNVLDEVYHEAYTPLDGIKRSFLFNVTIPFKKLL